MNLIREKLSSLSLNEIEQLAEDYENYERSGVIGSCSLRTIAEELGGSSSNHILIMITVALEVYRLLAKVRKTGLE